jgi:hypothetical protein
VVKKLKNIWNCHFFVVSLYQETKNTGIMTDKELFNEVFENLSARNSKLSMSGTIVCYDGRLMFNTDGYNLGYNLFRLTKLLNEIGEFR